MTWHIVSLSTGENIFQLDKEVRRLKLAQKVVLRLFMLTKNQINSLANAPEEVTKLVAFYAVIKTDLLLFEFMNDVYSEKHSVGQVEISDKDIVAFLHGKEEIAKWADNNFVRVKNTYKAILCESFNPISQVIDILLEVQLQTEEIYILSEDPKFMPKDEEES